MIAGNGITLSYQTQEADPLTPTPAQTLARQYQHCTFDGGWKTTAKLIDGPITDFNVIFNAQRVSAKVSIVKEGEINHIDTRADELFLFAHKEPSTCSLLDGKAPKKIEIPIGDLLHISGREAEKITVSGEGLICIEINDCELESLTGITK
jgi:environmental stress-induced protein Ves